jgi:hypothetical protein
VAAGPEDFPAEAEMEMEPGHVLRHAPQPALVALLRARAKEREEILGRRGVGRDEARKEAERDLCDRPLRIQVDASGVVVSVAEGRDHHFPTRLAHLLAGW